MSWTSMFKWAEYWTDKQKYLYVVFIVNKSIYKPSEIYEI